MGSLPNPYTHLQIYADLLQHTLQKPRQLNNITKALRNHKMPYQWVNPAKLLVTFQGSITITAMHQLQVVTALKSNRRCHKLHYPPWMSFSPRLYKNSLPHCSSCTRTMSVCQEAINTFSLYYCNHSKLIFCHPFFLFVFTLFSNTLLHNLPLTTTNSLITRISITSPLLKYQRTSDIYKHLHYGYQAIYTKGLNHPATISLLETSPVNPM